MIPKTADNKDCTLVSQDSMSSEQAIENTSNEAPEWLNKEYMENVLKIYKNDKSIKITNITITPALGKGENFGGIMTRIKVKYNCKCNKSPVDGHFIAKTSFEGDEFSKEKMKDYDIFNREIDVYQNILPKLREYLNEINDTDVLFPNTAYVDYKNAGIIFEDLSSQSFIMADRTQGLDIDHVKLALRKLAKLHATSTVLNEHHPEIFKTYDKGFFNKYTNSYATLFVNNLKICGERVSQLGADYKKYSDKIEKLVPQLMDIGREIFKAPENQLNSFVHGDFWTNNLMYKYGKKINENPQDAIILDFQYSFWGSPTIDLHYFMNTSMREDMRLRDEDELIHYYYNILSKTLKNLSFKGKIPTLNEFYIQYLEKQFFAFHSSCVIQPIMLNQETDDADFNALMAEDERAFNFKRTIYKNKKVEENLKKLLPYFDRRGILDIDLEHFN